MRSKLRKFMVYTKSKVSNCVTLAAWQVCSTTVWRDMHLGRSLLGSDMNTLRHGEGLVCTSNQAKNQEGARWVR